MYSKNTRSLKVTDQRPPPVEFIALALPYVHRRAAVGWQRHLRPITSCLTFLSLRIRSQHSRHNGSTPSCPTAPRLSVFLAPFAFVHTAYLCGSLARVSLVQHQSGRYQSGLNRDEANVGQTYSRGWLR